MNRLGFACVLVLMASCGCRAPAPTVGFDAVPGPTASPSNLPPLISEPVAASPPPPVPFAPAKKPTKPRSSDKPAPAPDAGLIVTPDDLLTGKVVSYNQPGRFVVLNFPVGRLPAVDQRLGVYRNGLKVGELKITGPQRDDNIVADVVEGVAQPGDEARDR